MLAISQHHLTMCWEIKTWSYENILILTTSWTLLLWEFWYRNPPSLPDVLCLQTNVSLCYCVTLFTRTPCLCSVSSVEFLGFIAAKTASCPVVCISVIRQYCYHREIKFLCPAGLLEVFNLTHSCKAAAMAASAHLKWKLPSQLYSPLVTSPRHYQLLARPRPALTLPHAAATLTWFFLLFSTFFSIF